MKSTRSTIVKAAVFAAGLLAAAPLALAFPGARLPSERAIREALMRSLQVQKVIAEISNFTQAAETWGFKSVVTPDPIEMVDNSGASVAVRLSYGNNYAVAARCGSECGHLRLVLKDAAGRTVMKSDNLNAKPALVFSPPDANWNGVYTVTLELAGCKTDTFRLERLFSPNLTIVPSCGEMLSQSSRRQPSASNKYARCERCRQSSNMIVSKILKLQGPRQPKLNILPHSGALAKRGAPLCHEDWPVVGRLLV